MALKHYEQHIEVPFQFVVSARTKAGLRRALKDIEKTANLNLTRISMPGEYVIKHQAPVRKEWSSQGVYRLDGQERMINKDLSRRKK